ncbi:hypothetical protein GW17_00002818 [Ensete ventricosum]|nr:hypothetical protein GW17_00002818 [Ensete ventricosum]
MRLAGAIGPDESQNRYGSESVAWLGGDPRAVRAPFGCRMIRRPRGMATKKEIAGLRRSSEPSFTFVLRVRRDSRGAHRSDPTVGFDVVGTPNGRDRASQRTRVPCHCPAKKGGRGTSGRPTRRWRWRWRVAGGGGRQHFSVFGNPPITAIVGLVRRDHAIRARHE